jgi:glycogen debranching enzyme
MGTISEIFDAEPPFTPRGCIAQAWGVAEFLRCWMKTDPKASKAEAGAILAKSQAPALLGYERATGAR